MESQKSLQQRFNQGDWDEPQIKEKFSDIPSQMLEKYEFFHGIGQGTQGQVFEGRRKSDGAHVAIKKLDIACVSNWKEYELFHREANALAQIDIEGTAHFYEAVEYLDDEHPSAFIVQEFIEGRSLESLIKDGHRFTNAQIYDAALQLIEILKKLHCRENPVIHRDLKPSNVILSPKADGCFKVCLIDFGAVANPQIQSGGSTVAGTYGYMPPEQLMGKPVPASDIYALGALLSHWLSGVDPADMQVADFRLLIEPHLENLPHAVVSTLRNMLTPAVDNRLCDYELLDKAFRSFLSPDKDDLQAAESVLMSGDLEKRFKEVKSLGQTGNIELWHSLSDSVPREIPKCYKKIEPKRNVQKRELVDPKVK